MHSTKVRAHFSALFARMRERETEGRRVKRAGIFCTALYMGE